jgi:hypothetical protein
MVASTIETYKCWDHLPFRFEDMTPLEVIRDPNSRQAVTGGPATPKVSRNRWFMDQENLYEAVVVCVSSFFRIISRIRHRESLWILNII